MNHIALFTLTVTVTVMAQPGNSWVLLDSLGTDPNDEPENKCRVCQFLRSVPSKCRLALVANTWNF